MHSLRFGALGALAVFVSAGSAQAAGLSVARFGGERGTPTTEDATALYYNPAGIGFSEGTHLYVDLTGAWRKASYEHQRAPGDFSGPGEESNYGKAELFNVIASPSLGFTYQLGAARLGVGFFTPFGGAAKWGKNSEFENDAAPIGARDGVQRWYTIDGELRTSYVPLTVAYRVARRFSVGLAGNLLISKVSTVRARNADGTNNVTTEGRSWVDVSGIDFSVGLGVAWDAARGKLRLGASWQSAPNLNGKMTLEGKLHNNLTGASVEDSDVKFDQQLPNVFRLGATYIASDELELRLFGDYTTWSAMKYQCVYPSAGECHVDTANNFATNTEALQVQVRDWHDTFSVRGSASYFTSKTFEVLGGVGFASSAVPARTLEPAIMDFPSISASAGVRVKVGSAYISPSYTQVFYLSRDNTGESKHPSYAPPRPVTPDAGGKYSQTIGVLNVNVDWKF